MAPAGEKDELLRHASERRVDITHVTIGVTPGFHQRALLGTTTIAFTPIVEPLSALKPDAVDLNVASVESPSPVEGYYAKEEVVELRKTVDELKTEVGALRKEIEDLRKQGQAKLEAGAAVSEDLGRQ